MNYIQALYIFLILMVIIFNIDYFLINKRKLHNKKKKNKPISELDYLTSKFKLNSKKLDKSKIIIWISLINSFIISFTSALIMLLPFKLIWQMLIAFGLLFALIYSLYEIYGRHLQKIYGAKK